MLILKNVVTFANWSRRRVLNYNKYGIIIISEIIIYLNYYSFN